jgi:hypothetical protein
LKVFAGSEANGATGFDVDFGAGAGIASNAGLSRFDGKDTKAAQLDSFASAQGILHALQDLFHGLFGTRSRKPRPVYYTLNEILLNHSRIPSQPVRAAF